MSKIGGSVSQKSARIVRFATAKRVDLSAISRMHRSERGGGREGAISTTNDAFRSLI